MVKIYYTITQNSALELAILLIKLFIYIYI